MICSPDQYSNELVISVLNTIQELNHLKDVDTILDQILYEARKLTNADAGSIFLHEDSRLKFSYVHNDTLFSKDDSNAELYADFTIPVDETSIVGYAALTKEILAIDNAYNIPEDRPYTFNPHYDNKSGYKTISILTLPLMSFQNRLVGVMQLINAKNESGKVIPFSEDSKVYLPFFANNASVAIERGIMHRELILRMVKMSELKDPKETGAHVQRVGAYSAEIYERWARNHKIKKKERKRVKDLIRLASMLHDVGKVGVTDFILKKPGKLTNEEFAVMKWHTVYGARLFIHNTSELDIMSSEIALNHHEKWDGSGYPGKINNIMGELQSFGAPKKHDEIPISARITSLADVFDALSSRRSYKDPWPDEKVLSIIESDSGTHFDPEVVEVFFQIFDVIKAIREKYKDTVQTI